MKSSGISVAAIGFAILVIAIDFAVIRAAFLSPGSEGWEPGSPPTARHAGRAQFLSPGAHGWAVFAFFLLPMIDALLIGVYRLRRRGDHTAGTVGYRHRRLRGDPRRLHILPDLARDGDRHASRRSADESPWRASMVWRGCSGTRGCRVVPWNGLGADAKLVGQISVVLPGRIV